MTEPQTVSHKEFITTPCRLCQKLNENPCGGMWLKDIATNAIFCNNFIRIDQKKDITEERKHNILTKYVSDLEYDIEVQKERLKYVTSCINSMTKTIDKIKDTFEIGDKK